MPCEKKDLGDGSVAIVCSRRPSYRCVHCGRRADLLCDFPVIRGKTKGTCDARLCGACTTKADGMDLCRPHAGLWADQKRVNDLRAQARDTNLAARLPIGGSGDER